MLFLLSALVSYGQAGNKPSGLPIDSVYKAALRVHNPNNTTLTFTYRWGNGKWQAGKITPFQTMVYSYNYYRGDYSSPTFNIRYDWITGDGKITPVIKELKRTKVKKTDMSEAQTYYFVLTGNQVRLYEFGAYDTNWVAAVKIENRTKNVLSYESRWQNSSTWNKVTLKPGHNRWVTNSYYPGVYNSPVYKIRFDHVLGDGKTTWKYFDLDRNKSAKSKPQDSAKRYFFSTSNQSLLNLYDSDK